MKEIIPFSFTEIEAIIVAIITWLKEMLGIIDKAMPEEKFGFEDQVTE